MLVEFANLPLDQFRKFERKWQSCFPWLINLPAETQETIREIWDERLDGKASVAEITTRLRLGDRHPWEWSNLHPPEKVARTVPASADPSDTILVGDCLEGPPIHVDWNTGTVVLLPRTGDEALWIAVLENSQRLAICGNANCQHPYFLRYRPKQLFCSKPCAQPAQRESKRKWWNQHGSAQRNTKRRMT